MSNDRYDVLATDYDGTLAHDGRVDASTVGALERAKAAGLRLVLVTGRELADLSNTFPRLDLFDRVVAENGAVLFDPWTSYVRSLAPAPPTALVERLQRQHVPVSAGRAIVATVDAYRREVQEALRDLRLDCHIIENKTAIMVLPAGVTKASGLSAALAELGLSSERAVGIGDAENDVALLEACGLAVAVANALPEVKRIADLVTQGSRGIGVEETIERLLSLAP
jgi:hypothetical protein